MDDYSTLASQLHPHVVYQANHLEESITPERQEVLARLSSAERVLEVGAATGYFSNVLMSVGHQVTAVEGDVRAVEIARAKGIDVRHGNIENRAVWDELTGPYDVVLFMHVLEHLVDPWNVLRTVRDRLSDRGRVISLIPNVAAWRIRKDLFFHGSFQYADTGILDRTHLRFFTLSTAIDLHKAAGFDLVEWVPTDVCVPLERRLRVQLRQKRLAQLWKTILSERFPNLCSEIVLFEARVGSR